VLALAVLLPSLWLRLKFTRGDRASFLLVRQYARRMLRFIGCRVDVQHLERVPADGPLMFVANHISVADAAVLIAVLPFDFRFVANHVYAAYPLLGVAIHGASASIVDRGSWRSRADSGQAMVDTLANGQSLLVFPEGTTADDGTMLPFRSGAFRAAARTRTAVVPIALQGTREMMPADRMLLAPAPITIDVLAPIVPSDPTREGVADLRDRAAQAIRARLASSVTAS
jgi:1-acyl-sn-glycerol-3-phosphate acyltransferase